MLCISCGAFLDIPSDATDGELISCPLCGTELMIQVYRDVISITEAPIEGEDWGE